MLTQTDFNAIQAFAKDTSPDAHIFGYVVVHASASGVIDPESNLGTVPINSAEMEVTDYFITSSSIDNLVCGYKIEQINKIELTKGHSCLVIISIKNNSHA